MQINSIINIRQHIKQLPLFISKEVISEEVSHIKILSGVL